MTPHLFRHVVAKIIVERGSSMYMAVSRHLGHRSMSATLASYLGTETRAAGRRLNRILEKPSAKPIHDRNSPGQTAASEGQTAGTSAVHSQEGFSEISTFRQG